MSDWQHDGLTKLFDLLVQATNVAVLLLWSFLNFHGFDSRVVLSRQLIEDDVRVFIDTHQLSRLEFDRVDESWYWQEYCVACACLDDDSLAFELLLQIDNALVLLLGLKVQDFDDV